MSEVLRPDICVVGGGTGGLAVAIGAAQLGASTVLVRGRDPINHGCIPSRALIAAARRAHLVAEAGAFGILAAPAGIDYARLRQHIEDVKANLAVNNSAARLRALGVTVIDEDGHFEDTRTLTTGNVSVRARRFVLATGSRPSIPVIPGLSSVPYLTDETLFGLESCPGHLMIIGGGPTGIEMAQAHVRLGARVTLIEAGRLLPGDDPELVDIVRTRLHREGVEVIEGVNVAEVLQMGESMRITIDTGEHYYWIDGSHVLVAAGRVPNIGELDPGKAGIHHDEKGIAVDRRLRTSNRRVFAIGDVASGPQYSHAAARQAQVVLRNALFRLSARADMELLPHVTYTDPELAHVGATEAEARDQFGRITLLRWPLGENDRAQIERDPVGLIKIILDKRGIVRGASIAAPGAGELIAPWIMAVSQRLRIGAMSALAVPYPNRSEISVRAAESYYTSTLFSARTRALVRFLSRFG
ncbi:MAG: FAD-dependent oxidoreductase [Parvibaculaceae bacterium]|nr:FAD-dependent oxidoreductase [Parvibaculaceae bacterium]